MSDYYTQQFVIQVTVPNHFDDDKGERVNQITREYLEGISAKQQRWLREFFDQWDIKVEVTD